MKHRALRIALLAALSTMLLASTAFAQGGFGGGGRRGHGGPGGPGGLGPRVAAELNLTEEQQQRLAALRAEHREDMAPVIEDMQELREELQGAWAAATPNRASILALGQRMDALHAAQRDLRQQHLAEANQILTAAQRARLAELRAQRGAGGERGPQGRGGRRHLDGGDDGAGVGRGPGRGPGPGLQGGRGERIAERLNLDESQQARIQTLRDEMRRDLEPGRDQMRALHEQLRTLRTSGNASPAAVAALQARLDAQRAAMRERQVDFRLAMASVLTAEQRAELAELGGPGRGRGHGRPGGHGPGPRGQGRRGGADAE